MPHSIFENSPKVQAQRDSIGENSKLLTSVAPHPSPTQGATIKTQDPKKCLMHISAHLEKRCKLSGRFKSVVFYNYFPQLFKLKVETMRQACPT